MPGPRSTRAVSSAPACWGNRGSPKPSRSGSPVTRGSAAAPKSFHSRINRSSKKPSSGSSSCTKPQEKPPKRPIGKGGSIASNEREDKTAEDPKKPCNTGQRILEKERN